ncbi:MAG TPA: glycosyltransferase family 4 protein [Streptosporangiales bacterium]
MLIRYLVLDDARVGGGVRAVVNQANALVGDHDVELVSVYGTARPCAFQLDPRVRRRRLVDMDRPRLRRPVSGALGAWRSRYVPPDEGRAARFSLATDVVLRRYLAGLDGGVLFTNRPALNLLSARFGSPRAVRVGQDHMNLRSYRPGVAAAIGRWYPRLDALTVLTHADAADYREALGPRLRVEVIPNMTATGAADAAPLTEHTVIAAGRLGRQKGFDLLIDAFARIVPERPDWRLQIFGGGRARGPLRERVTARGMTGHVFLMGRTQQLDEHMRKASVYALSSRYEGLPMVLLEAMACGVPVVAFDCHTGPAELVTDGVDGLLVPPGDVGALARAMDWLMGDAELRRRYGAAAIEAAQRYDTARVLPLWQRLITELTRP